jgi:hypothetical protein
MMLLVAGTVSAGTWYLMAGDEKALSEPDAAVLLSRGTSVGPIHMVARGKFQSRDRCETERHKVIHEFRKQGMIGRGGWTRHRIRSPSVFTQCVESTNPRLEKASAGESGLWMDVLIHPAKVLR